MNDTAGIAPLQQGHYRQDATTNSWVNLQEEQAGENVRLGVPKSLDNELAFELFGTSGIIMLDGLEKPNPLSLGEKCCIFRVLRIVSKCVLSRVKSREPLTSCM